MDSGHQFFIIITIFTFCIMHSNFVLVTPAINPKLMDFTQNEGYTASFTCQAMSRPIPIIRWYHKWYFIG